MEFGATGISFSTVRPHFEGDRRGTILLVYGKSDIPLYSRSLDLMAERLSRLGFTVILFDYQSNQADANFFSFGVSHRIKDVEHAIGYTKTFGHPPFSVLAFDMGAYVAIKAIVSGGHEKFFENIILVVPDAYPSEATKPGVLFGSAPGRFNDLRNKNSSAWITSDVFDAARKISADLLILIFERNRKLFSDRDKAKMYYDNFSYPGIRRTHLELPGRLMDIPGRSQLKRTALIVSQIEAFTSPVIAR